MAEAVALVPVAVARPRVDQFSRVGNSVRPCRDGISHNLSVLVVIAGSVSSLNIGSTQPLTAVAAAVSTVKYQAFNDRVLRGFPLFPYNEGT